MTACSTHPDLSFSHGLMLPISITVDVARINLDVRVKSVEQESTSSKKV